MHNSGQSFLPVASFAILQVNAPLTAKKGGISNQKESITKLKETNPMKKTISTIHIINAPSENVWANISKATGVNEWLPVITACHLDGDKRVCLTEQGEMNETILKVDNTNQVFQYAIDSQPLLPIENVVGTMKVNEKGEQTQLQWDLEFTIKDESLFEMVKQAVESMYGEGANGLEKISK